MPALLLYERDTGAEKEEEGREVQGGEAVAGRVVRYVVVATGWRGVGCEGLASRYMNKQIGFWLER